MLSEVYLYNDNNTIMYDITMLMHVLFQDTLIEKLRLKNSTLKVQKKKLDLQLKQVWIMHVL